MNREQATRSIPHGYLQLVLLHAPSPSFVYVELPIAPIHEYWKRFNIHDLSHSCNKNKVIRGLVQITLNTLWNF